MMKTLIKISEGSVDLLSFPVGPGQSPGGGMSGENFPPPKAENENEESGENLMMFPKRKLNLFH